MEFLLAPIEEENGVAKFFSWWTDCGRYCLTMVKSILQGGEDHWSVVWQDDGHRKLVTSDCRNFTKALQKLIDFHRARYEFDEEPIVGNAKDLEKESQKFLSLGNEVCYDDDAVSGFQTDKETIMKVSTKKAEELLTACGLTTPPEKLASRLNKIGEYVPEDAELTKDQKALVKSLQDAIAKGTKIEVGDGKEKAEKGNGEAKAEKKAKTPKASSGKKGGGQKHSLKAGTTIEREYKGKTHKVTVQDDGSLKCGGKSYTSLTELAKEITGAASISGPRFFNLV